MTPDNYEIITDLVSAPPDRSLETWYRYAKGTHFWMLWRNRALLNCLAGSGVPMDKDLKALDIGCGNGVVIEYLDQATRWVTDGVEIDPDALKTAYNGRGRLLLYDITRRNERFREAYDVVYLLDVLEHIEDTRGFLDAALFHLKAGGCLILGTPAVQRLFGAYDRAAGHLRRYDARSFTREFRGFDVDILDIRYWGLTLIFLAVLREMLLFRATDKEKILKRGFKPPGRLANYALSLVMRIETTILKRPPIGASIMVLARKNN